MQRIYLDNAATTAIDPIVVEEMLPYLTEKFGNPSSIYSYGREAKMAIEQARKSVAKHLGVKPANIFFTSGGTESTNTAIRSAICDLGCDAIISSPIEHHATLHTVQYCAKTHNIPLYLVKLREDGHIDLLDLERLLAAHPGKALVSLMHANNEIGNILDIEAVARLCKEYNAVFHCDTVQTVGHYPLDFNKLGIHFANGASHKFHGPKGVGILYISDEVKATPLLQGGAQERNMRAGTENTYGIVGFAKALDLAMERHEKDRDHVLGLKEYMMERLTASLPDVAFNGAAAGHSLYTVLNVSLPKNERSEMVLFNLDMAGVCVSGGSACSSGANAGSHVLDALCPNTGRVAIRFSFCRNNTKEEIDEAIEKLKSVI